ncbi:MAG: pirin family protein [Alphaproteobacteria bacterium]|nr:pirin family protein [Alphaproteobacteria bacterium]
MIHLYPYETLGHADHGWLNARHHFSFARYWNPKRLEFGALRVVNDDRIAAGKGFGAHPHNNMEIITYVKKGAISHKDSMKNEGRTKAGDVQVMSAGTGVFHSEYNAEPEDTTLYQIWIEPNEKNVAPRWKAKEFPKEPVTDKLAVLVSGQAQHAGKNALFIHQDAAIYGGTLTKGTVITQPIKHQAYILASVGNFTINGMQMQQGDGAEVTGESIITIAATSDAEVLVIDVPAQSLSN